MFFGTTCAVYILFCEYVMFRRCLPSPFSSFSSSSFAFSLSADNVGIAPPVFYVSQAHFHPCLVSLAIWPLFVLRTRHVALVPALRATSVWRQRKRLFLVPRIPSVWRPGAAHVTTVSLVPLAISALTGPSALKSAPSVSTALVAKIPSRVRFLPSAPRQGQPSKCNFIASAGAIPFVTFLGQNFKVKVHC